MKDLFGGYFLLSAHKLLHVLSRRTSDETCRDGESGMATNTSVIGILLSLLFRP